MKITFIKTLNKGKNDEGALMKFLRSSERDKTRGKHAFSREETKKKKRDRVKSHVQENKKGFFKELFERKILKKNQIVLATTALMLVTAGYMNYSNNIKMASLGDAQLVSTNVIVSEGEKRSEKDIEESKVDNEEIVKNEDTNSNDNVNTNTNVNEKAINTSTKNEDDYFTKTKLERETMYSQMIETYQKILENANIPNDQKSIASNEIKNINERKKAIATMENLIKTKEIDDLVILFNDTSVNIVVKSKEELPKEKVAQITNIVTREAQVDIQDIHISIK